MNDTEKNLHDRQIICGSVKIHEKSNNNNIIHNKRIDKDIVLSLKSLHFNDDEINEHQSISNGVLTEAMLKEESFSTGMIYGPKLFLFDDEESNLRNMYSKRKDNILNMCIEKSRKKKVR